MLFQFEIKKNLSHDNTFQGLANEIGQPIGNFIPIIEGYFTNIALS